MKSLEYFRKSVTSEIEYIKNSKNEGKHAVGIYCEFSPREIIMAADAIPVCLCGTSQNTIQYSEPFLPANLCPLIKSSFGYIAANKCPFFEMSDLIVAETTCDGKKKMFEFIQERKETHILELTQKSDSEHAFNHWLIEIKDLKKRIEKLFNKEITDTKLLLAIKEMNKERALLLKAFELGKRKPSIVSGKELIQLRYRVAGFEQHIKNVEAFITEVEERAISGYIAAPEEAPRIVLTGCPIGHGTEKVIEIVEETGGIVVAQENCSGIKPLYEPVDETADPTEAIARKYFNLPCSCMTPNTGRMELIEKIVREYEADIVIDLVWHACHTYNVESHSLGNFVKNKLGLQYLKIETDYSAEDREQLKVRIQTLLELAAQ